MSAAAFWTRGWWISCEKYIIISTRETDNILFREVKYKVYNSCISETVRVDNEYSEILSPTGGFVFILLPLLICFWLFIYLIMQINDRI